MGMVYGTKGQRLRMQGWKWVGVGCSLSLSLSDSAYLRGSFRRVLCCYEVDYR